MLGASHKPELRARQHDVEHQLELDNCVPEGEWIYNVQGGTDFLTTCEYITECGSHTTTQSTHTFTSRQCYIELALQGTNWYRAGLMNAMQPWAKSFGKRDECTSFEYM